MDKLMMELQRLYFLRPPPGGGQESGSLELVGPDGGVRTLVVGFPGTAGWEGAARLLQGVREDLDLPSPAVSVTGEDGFQVWLSLAGAVPADRARAFLDALRRRYLAGIPAADLCLHPGPQTGNDRVKRVPARLGEGGRWSAFIDPTLGGLFGEEPWLDMPPNPDKQAGLLADVESIGFDDFQRALDLLQAPAGPVEGETGGSAGRSTAEPQPAARPQASGIGDHFSDPRRFLLAVMNDPTVSLDRRIEAARALLPCFMETPPA